MKFRAKPAMFLKRYLIENLYTEENIQELKENLTKKKTMQIFVMI